MTTLSASRTRAYTNTHVNGLLVPANTTIYAGAAVGLNAGNPRPLRAGDKFIGFAQSSVNHIRGQEREAPLTVVDSGQVQLLVSGAVLSDVGKDVYATDDDTFTLVSTGGVFVGVAKQLISAGKLLVEIASPSNMNGVRRSTDGLSLVDGAGNTVMPPVGAVVQAALMGDSMTASAGLNTTITSATRSNGVVTAVASGVNLTTGMIVRVYNCLDTSYNNNAAYATRVDSNTFTYLSPGADGSTTNLSEISTMQVQNNAHLNSNSYLFWLNAKTNGAFSVLINGGNNGNTSAQMLSRFTVDCLAYSPQAVIIFTGYNDFPNTSRTAAQAYADVVAMIAQCAGKLVIVVSAIPWTTGGATANRVEAAKYNRMIRAYCNSTPRCRYADAAKYLVDASNATRFSPLAGMLRSDGIHPTPKAAERIAQAIIDAAQYDFPRPSRLVSSNADTYGYDATNPNILDSAPFANSGGSAPSGGASGTAAPQYTLTLTNTSTAATLVASCPARADAIGYDQQAVFTPGGAGDVCTFSIGTGNISGRFSAGDTVQLLGELSLSGLSGANIRGFAITMSLPGTSGASPVLTDAAESTLAAQIGIDGVYTIVSNEIPIPVGCTGISFAITFTSSAAGTALTAKLGRVSIEKL